MYLCILSTIIKDMHAYFFRCKGNAHKKEHFKFSSLGFCCCLLFSRRLINNGVFCRIWYAQWFCSFVFRKSILFLSILLWWTNSSGCSQEAQTSRKKLEYYQITKMEYCLWCQLKKILNVKPAGLNVKENQMSWPITYALLCT